MTINRQHYSPNFERHFILGNYLTRSEVKSKIYLVENGKLLGGNICYGTDNQTLFLLTYSLL
jgi:hypothetical protein